MNLNGQLQAPPGTTELEAGWVEEKNPWPLPEIEVRFLELLPVAQLLHRLQYADYEM
jgi:hypothetical protein